MTNFINFLTNKDNYEIHYDEIDLKPNIWRKMYDYIFDHEFLRNILIWS